MLKGSSVPQHSQQEETERKNVIVKTRKLRRQFLPWRRRGLKLNKLSNRTAMSTVCSFEEAYEARQQDVARTLCTQSGTEALYCPQQESRYLHHEGMKLHAQGRHEEAIEALTQALSLSDGSNLEPHILWTLVSRHAQQEEEQEAGSYLRVLKPLMSKIQDDWIQQEASLPMMTLLMEYKEWSTALKMSCYIQTDDSVLARLYYETAANLTTEEALPQLEKALALCHESQDESLRQSILHTMVHAHAAEQEWEEALSVQESYMESLESPLDIQQAHLDAAELYIAQGHYQQALDSLNQGLELGDNKTTTKLLQAKAHVLYKFVGDIDKALDIYSSLLLKVKHCPSDAAKLYYTMARICCSSKRYEQALEYYTGELKVTRAALGKHDLATCRIYEDMARVYDEHFGDYEQALKYYNKALKVQHRCLKRASTPSAKREVSTQILETQRCIGRIHYKRGEFGKAFTVSFHDDVSVE